MGDDLSTQLQSGHTKDHTYASHVKLPNLKRSIEGGTASATPIRNDPTFHPSM